MNRRLIAGPLATLAFLGAAQVAAAQQDSVARGLAAKSLAQQPTQGLGQTLQTHAVYATFDKLNGLLTTGMTSESGDAFYISGAAVNSNGPYVLNGALNNLSPANALYAYLAAPPASPNNPNMEFWGTFSWNSAVSGSDPTYMTATTGIEDLNEAKGPNALANIAAHLNCGPQHCDLTDRINNVFTGIWHPSFPGAIRTDGTKYRFGVACNLTTYACTAYAPDGETYSWTDNNLATVLPAGSVPSEFTEILNTGAGYKTYINGMGISPTIDLPALEGAAHLSDLSQLRGSGPSYRQPIGNAPGGVVLTGGAGWYTLAGNGAFHTVGNVGDIRLHADDGSSAQDWIIRGGCLSVGGNRLQQEAGYTYGATIIDQIECSDDGATNTRIRIHQASSSTSVNLTGSLDGAFQYNGTPTVGATALSSGVYTLTFQPNMKQGGFLSTLAGGDASIVDQAATTGSTYAIGTTSNGINLTAGATLAAETITLPTNLYTGRQASICSTQAVTALTISGGTLANAAPTGLTAGQCLKYRYNATAAVWYVSN